MCKHGKLPRPGHGTRKYPLRVRYTDPAGRERSKSFAKVRDAKAYLATTEADLIRGQWTDPAKGRVTLAAYAQDGLSGRSGEPGTLAGLRVRVERHIVPSDLGRMLPSAPDRARKAVEQAHSGDGLDRASLGESR